MRVPNARSSHSLAHCIKVGVHITQVTLNNIHVINILLLVYLFVIGIIIRVQQVSNPELITSYLALRLRRSQVLPRDPMAL